VGCQDEHLFSEKDVDRYLLCANEKGAPAEADATLAVVAIAVVEAKVIFQPTAGLWGGHMMFEIPVGDTGVQSTWHFAPSSGAPFSAS
jgi:hypothetical protein